VAARAFFAGVSAPILDDNASGQTTSYQPPGQ
jgi:hypothetical protein